MSRPSGQSPPPYKVYRARKRPFLRGADLEALRRRLGRERAPRERRPITPGRVVKWLALAALAWIGLSLVLFMISAQLQDSVSSRAEEALSSKGNLFSGSNVLVLGSDARIGQSIDKSQQGPSRSDTIMIVHAGFGTVRKLSIPRDVQADIPGHGVAKINAAYAIGGPALAIKTVESFLGNGLKIDHVVELDFKNFPRFIDALGGIEVNNRTKICSPPFDNFWKGFRLPKGHQELDGTEALGYARVRKNRCAPGEDDRDRARRQQEVLSGIRHSLLSPGAFIRLPWISWEGPKTLRSDMRGPALLALFADMATGGTGKTEVLDATCCANGTNLLASEASRRAAVRKLLGEE